MSLVSSGCAVFPRDGKVNRSKKDSLEEISKRQKKARRALLKRLSESSKFLKDVCTNLFAGRWSKVESQAFVRLLEQCETNMELGVVRQSINEFNIWKRRNPSKPRRNGWLAEGVTFN